MTSPTFVSKDPVKATPALVARMQNIAHTTSDPIHRKMADFMLWWTENSPRIPRENLTARAQFVETAMSCLMEINADLLQRLYEVEHGKSHSTHLWLPKGIKLNAALS